MKKLNIEPLLSIITSILESIRKIITSLALILLIGYFAVLVLTSLLEKKIIIDDFNVSSGILVKGYNSKFISTKLVKEINQIRNTGNSYFRKEFNSTDIVINFDNEIQLPDVGLEGYMSFILQKLDRNTHIKGELVGDTMISFIFSVNNEIFEVHAKNLDSAIYETSISILREIDPINLAAYLNSIHDIRAQEVALKLLNDTDKKNDAFARHYLASSQLLHNKWKIARLNFYKALEQFDRKELEVPSLNNIGASYFLERKALGEIPGRDYYFDSATYYYNKALKIDPTYYGSYLNISNIMNINQKYDSAQYFLQKANLLRPKDSFILAMMANTYYARKDSTSCDNLINQAMEVRPLDARAYALYIVLGLQRKREGQDIYQELNTLWHLDNTIDKQIYISVESILVKEPSKGNYRDHDKK